MNILQAKDILFSSKTEWNRIVAEENNHMSLYLYGVLFIVVSNLLVGFGFLLISQGSFSLDSSRFTGAELLYDLLRALSLVFWLLALWILPKIIAMVSGWFGGERNTLFALKLYIFAMTPFWIGSCLLYTPHIGHHLSLIGDLAAVFFYFWRSGEAMAVEKKKRAGFSSAALALSAATYFPVHALADTLVRVALFSHAIANMRMHQ
jgi:hypothetical protein